MSQRLERIGSILKRPYTIALLIAVLLVLMTVGLAAAADRGAWAPNVSYAINDTVTYNGATYKCLQAHTSLVGWEPATTPALWQQVTGGTPPPTTPPPATTPPPTTPPPTGNLALNRPATGSASCNTNETPAKAVNGSVSGGNTDKFCSAATTKFLQVDLGSSRSVNQFIVKHAGAGGESASYNTRGFNIQTSTDNVNWSTAVTVTTNTANISTHTITARNARYVRMNITQPIQATGGASRIYEFEVYGGGTPPPTTPPPTTPPPTTPPPTTPPPTTPPPTGGTCQPAWVATTAYSTGAQVSRNGRNYQAAYWTQGNDPLTNSGPAGSGEEWIVKEFCSTGPTPVPTTPVPGTFGSIMTEAQFNQMFPSRNAFYTYAGLVNAQSFWTLFGGEGTTTLRKQEVAAAMANFAHETGGLWYITEIAQGLYCDAGNTQYPCAAGQRYYGRGPIQLSWNFNYGAAGQVLGLPLLTNPNLVEQDASVAWKTAIWYWMTQNGPGTMPAHQCIVSGAGFGCTIRSINGALECNGGNGAQVQSRINYFNTMLGILGVPAPPGALGC